MTAEERKPCARDAQRLVYICNALSPYMRVVLMRFAEICYQRAHWGQNVVPLRK